jgi:hypothetical protein
MDVFLLPVGLAQPGTEPRVQMYCEPPPEPVPDDAGGQPQRRSFFGRLADGFRRALAEGEAEERRQEEGHAPTESGSRLTRFVKRKLAAAVAEQRLLWHLRHATAARLHHPTTITSARALEIVIAEFKKDFAKHRLWCIIDAVIVVAQTPLAFVPGPNFVAYYFIFRAVGHFFSMRGAQKGMEAALWTTHPSEPLSDLQQALTLEPSARTERIAAIAATLGLARLVAFMRRVAERGVILRA